jgi:hypothetical protein
MSTFSIPWKCLDLTIEPKIITKEPQKPQKTFAQALAPTNLCDIPLSQFQQPVVKGDRLAIEIPEAAKRVLKHANTTFTVVFCGLRDLHHCPSLP